MATPSSVELISQLQKIIGIYELWRTHAMTATTGLIARIDALEQAFEGDAIAQMEAGLAAMRAAASQGLTSPTLLEAHLQDWGRYLNAEGDTDTIVDALIGWMLDNSQTVNSRNLTLSQPTPDGGNTGTGLAYRITVDANGYPLEAVDVPDAFTARCTGDANTTTKRNSEVFLVTGGYGSPDELEALGSGFNRSVTARNSGDSLLINCGFDKFSGTASAPTDIQDWTSSITVNGTNFEFNTSPIYLPKTISTETRYSLRAKASCTLTQRFDLTGAKINPRLPLLAFLPWNRDAGSAAGTLGLAVGSKSNTVVLAAQTGWNLLHFLATPNHKNAWYANFKQDQLALVISWTQTGGTGVDLDDLLVVQYEPESGTYIIIAAGATPYSAGDITESVAGDLHTWSNAEAGSDAKIQRHFAALLDRYLPSDNTGSETITDPT